MAVTIKDLVKETGLGNATISAYLNGVAVRPYNKEKIEKAIEKLGYIRNEYARGLKMHKSNTIGVLIPELSNIFSTTIISEMEEILRGKGYGVIVCDCKSDAKLEKESMRFLLSKMVDGLIVMPISTDGEVFKIAKENDIPVTIIDRMTECKRASHIVINNREVSENAVNELIAKGYKKIGIVSGNDDIYTAKERKQGYKEALEKVGSYDENLVYDGKLTIEGSYIATKKMLEEHSDIQAVFVTNYEMTMGSLIAMSEKGIKVGTDIGFIGFDNQEIAKMFSPKLRTVAQPLKQIGQQAANTILGMIEGERPVNIVLNASMEN